MGQIGPRDIGADLDFGADLALSILQCTVSTLAYYTGHRSWNLIFNCLSIYKEEECKNRCFMLTRCGKSVLLSRIV